MTDREIIVESLELTSQRWRLRRGLEAAVRSLTALVAFLVVWAVVWALLGGSERLAVAGRVLAFLTLLGAAWYWLRRWLAPRPNPTQVALYVEERAPGFDQTLVSAVTTLDGGEGGLAARVRAAARERLDRVDRGRQVEAVGLKRAGGWLGGITVGSIALLAFGPAWLKEPTLALVDPARPIATPPVMMVSVSPGDAEVPKGGAVEIGAILGGFSSDNAEVVTRRDTTADWERLPMSRDSAGKFVTRLFDLDRAAEYFVEAAGVRSPTYRLTVVDLPAVRQISATILYPKYTGLAAESITDAGDLAVLTGSTVAFRVATTRPAKAAYLVVERRPPVPMAGAPGAWVANLRITGDAFYRIDLEGEDGRKITGLNYAIDALEDRPPTVRFTAPGRDTKPTSVEEVTAQVEASDDFGVGRLTISFSVNGMRDTTLLLTDSTVRALKDLSAAHTFFLEEWSLSPGDLVSYYATATDGIGQAAKSDMYFLEIRPFDRAYREAEQGGGGGGGGNQDTPDGLSERQRQLVVGTFNVVRDSATQAADYAENVTTLAIGQGKLRTDVTGLVARMRQRQMASVDSTFRTIATELDSALVEMAKAEETLGKRQARSALPEEQRALQHLQRAEAAFREVMVSMGQQGGGGGGGAQRQAEELADLFELETDKIRNQYESVQREAGQQAERQLDETLERLRRLASRQEQENERMQRAADALRGRSSQSSGGGGGGGGNQRQLAQEAEEEARRLERLAREKGDRTMEDAARRLREAAEQMRRGASANAEQGAAQGAEALERLRTAAKDLERSRGASQQEAIRQLGARANQLKREQREAADQATSLPGDPAQRGERIGALESKKDALAKAVERLEADADRLSREGAKGQPNAARKLAQAAEGIRENRIRDKLLFSKDLLRRASPQYQRNFEDQIGANLEELAEQLDEAAGALQQNGQNQQEQALERARDLVRGLESLNERARAAQQRGRAEGNQPGQQQRQPGAQGQGQQPGEPGQRGPAGQQGQQGQEGQQGQQGQAAEGTGQGGQPGGQPSADGGRFDNDGTRQFVRELRVRRQAAESLRADLRALGQETRDLDRLLQDLRALDNARTFGDPKGLDRLEQDVIGGLKELEFALWRRFGTEGGDRPAAGATARVPPQYRELVEEYYRSLARQRPPDR